MDKILDAVNRVILDLDLRHELEAPHPQYGVPYWVSAKGFRVPVRPGVVAIFLDVSYKSDGVYTNLSCATAVLDEECHGDFKRLIEARIRFAKSRCKEVGFGATDDTADWISEVFATQIS